MWALLYAKKAREAEAVLLDMGAIYFRPMLKVTGYVHRIRKWKEWEKPVFPNYIFVQESYVWLYLQHERRVGRFFFAGGQPIIIEDRVVQDWKSGRKEVAVGDAVLIAYGPFEGRGGVVKSIDGANAVVVVGGVRTRVQVDKLLRVG